MAENGLSPEDEDMPTAVDLKNAQRHDLLNAISKAGGFKAVAQQVGLKSVRKRRKAVGYWEDVEHVKQEVLSFVAENRIGGEETRMPTLAELRTAGRVDLEQGIRKHGGFRKVAAVIGIQPAAQRREDGFWKDFLRVKEALQLFVAQRDEQASLLQEECRGEMDGAETSVSGRNILVTMPSQRELRDAGRSDLAQAITEFHDGFGAVGERMGYKRRTSDLSEFYKLAQELLRFCREEMKNLPVMPNSSMLRKHGRSDLLAAITKHGGMASVSERLGLQYIVRTREIYRDWDAFRRGLLAYTESQGTPGQMPSSRELRNFNRSDLYQGILYWGGPRVVAQKVGLAVSNYWQYFHFVGAQVLDFIDKHGTPGVMPTESDFLEVGQVTLNLATQKFGNNQVATRLGLKELRQTTQAALDTMMDRCLFYDNRDGEEDDDEDEGTDPLLGFNLSVDDLKLPDRTHR
jgi:hypothetical protein